MSAEDTIAVTDLQLSQDLLPCASAEQAIAVAHKHQVTDVVR